MQIAIPPSTSFSAPTILAMNASHHIAQANYALWKPHVTQEEMHEFLSFAEKIQLSASKNPALSWQNAAGFWGDQEVITTFNHDRIILNISVWQSTEALKVFVYQDIHGHAMQSRALWFEAIEQQAYVLWWVPQGHQPTVQEAKQKFDYLHQHGATTEVFTFAEL